MTILARTSLYLVEYEAGFLSIARYSDGYCKAAKSKGVAGQFRACLKTHAPEFVIETYLRMMRRFEWEPLYKPHRMPGVDPEWDAQTSAAEQLAKLESIPDVATRRKILGVVKAMVSSDGKDS